MSDLISRAEAKEALRERLKRIPTYAIWAMHIIDELPTHPTPSNTLGALDCVERRLVSYKLTDLVNEFEEILSHIREREENDSVCGLCEYDGAYMGQSGNWCNECPGFDKADCFKLKDKYKKEWLELMNTLPSVQPETAKRIVGKSRDGMTLWYQCDMCNEPVDVQDNYCRGCGRRMIGR